MSENSIETNKPAPSSPDGDYAIFLLSTKLNLPAAAKTLTGNDHVHKEVVFVDLSNGTGRVIAAFNGNAYDRRTGDLMTASTSGKDALRVDIGTKIFADRGGFPDSSTLEPQVLARGGKEEMMDIVTRGVLAADLINRRNLNYSFLDQNSNSVAATIVAAMGLQMPPNPKGISSPGDTHILLKPDDIKEIPRAAAHFSSSDQEAYIKNSQHRFSLDSIKKDLKSEAPTAPKFSAEDTARPATNAVADARNADVLAKLATPPTNPREAYERCIAACVILQGSVDEKALKSAMAAGEDPHELRRSAEAIHKLAIIADVPQVKTAMETMDASMRVLQVAANPDTDIKPALGTPGVAAGVSPLPEGVRTASSPPNPAVAQKLDLSPTMGMGA